MSFVRRVSVPACALTLAGAAGCRALSTEPDPGPAGCTGVIDVTVAAGSAPVFSWSPACGISFLVVEEVDPELPAPRSAWGFAISERVRVGPDVVYGRVPEGATEWTPAQSLRTGATYRVRVGYTSGGNVLVAGGAESFVR